MLQCVSQRPARLQSAAAPKLANTPVGGDVLGGDGVGLGEQRRQRIDAGRQRVDAPAHAAAIARTRLTAVRRASGEPFEIGRNRLRPRLAIGTEACLRRPARHDAVGRGDHRSPAHRCTTMSRIARAATAAASSKRSRALLRAGSRRWSSSSSATVAPGGNTDRRHARQGRTGRTSAGLPGLPEGAATGSRFDGGAPVWRSVGHNPAARIGQRGSGDRWPGLRPVPGR